MKLFRNIIALLLTVTLLPTFSAFASGEVKDVASGKEITYSSSQGGYVLDLGRAYPVSDIQISGVSTSSTQLIMSNNPEFPSVSLDELTNIAIGKPIRSKLYGEGGFNENSVAQNAVDNNASTQFISTPAKDSVEWLTIDLGQSAFIDSITVDFTANRTYSVAVTNSYHGQTEEFIDGVTLIESGSGTKKFILPDEYINNTFQYVRLRFEGDAASDDYLDVNMYVNEIRVNGCFVTNPESTISTTTLIKNNSTFTLNNAARDRFYRYLKIRRVSRKPTVVVNAKKELADCINIAKDADVTIPENAIVDDTSSLDNINDEDFSTITTFTYNNPYIQFDLHEQRAISHVEVYCRQDMLSDRNNIKILLSNSPDFEDYFVLGKQHADETIGLNAAFVRSRSNIFDGYRYVRVYEGETSLALSEIKIFANLEYDNLYNVSGNVFPTADVNEKTAYRATDNDNKSYWKGNKLTVNLDRCYNVNAINITANGNLKITYGCTNGTNNSYTDTFENNESKNIIFSGNINYIKIEATDSNIIKVYNVSVYSKNKNVYIGKIEPESITTYSSDYDVVDLGRTVIIDHIEPCDSSFEISDTEDFDISTTVTGCQLEPVSVRYVKIPSDSDTTVIGYDSPELIKTREGKTVEFNKELYNENATAIAAVYEDDKTFKSAMFSDISSGSLKIDEGDNASFFVWDGLSGIKPLLPKADTVLINRIPQAEFYVDPDVTVSGNGSENSPFKTILEAQNAVRAINDSMTGDIIVYLKGGRYYLDDTLAFNNSDSGTNGYKVIYKNAEGETPILTGGKPVTGFKEGNNGIWYAKADDFDSIYDLMVNGEVASLAKTETPIQAEAFYSNGTSYLYDGISFSKEKLPMLSNPEDVFVHVTRSWVDLLLKVTSATEKDGLINLDILQPRFDDVTADGALTGHQVIPSSNFYIENALELLDNPGEFYFDKGTKVLYYMPRSGEDMTTAIVEGAVLDDIITIKGTDKNNHIENLTLSGLRIENSTFERMYKYGFKTAQAQVITYDKSVFIDGAIQIDYASNIEISDCEITGLVKPAISMHNGVLDTRICNNRIYNVGDSAIVVGSQFHHYISGTYELTQRVTVADNIVHKTGQKQKGAPAIACYYVIDVDVVHNKITDSNYSGISLGWGWNNYPDSTTCRNNTVSNNYIENVNLAATDGGPIYTLGNQPGTIIEGNYVVQTKIPEQKTGINGIYPDEGSAYITIRNNVIDMLSIKDYAENVRDISLFWQTDKDIYAHSNYATYTNSINRGTNCRVEPVHIYEKGNEPDEVKRIMDLSAINLK